MSDLDRLLAGPVAGLAALGVSEDEADLCRLRGAAAAAADTTRRTDRAEKIVRAGSLMSPEELRQAILDAAHLLGGGNGG